MRSHYRLCALLAILAPALLGAQESQRPFITGLCTRSDSALAPGSYVEHPERPPVLKPRQQFLAFPDTLHRPGYEGNVVVAFVVEANGHVRPGSVAVISSTDPVLSGWACRAVPTIRFDPGEDHGKRVASQAVMPFAYHGPPAP